MYRSDTANPLRRTTALAATLMFALILSPNSAVNAQSIENCGLTIQPEEVQPLFNHAMRLQNLKQLRADETYKIPIQHHIVRRSNGTGGFTQAELDNAMLEADAMHVQANVELYNYNPTNYIDEDYFYFDVSNMTQIDSLRSYDVEPAAINIYWVPSESNFPYCGISAFTFSSTQGIVMSNNCGGIGPSNSTLVHEIGHYFNLFHTHEGAFGDECPSGSNCVDAGDLICDTPADPNVQGQVTAPPACSYTGADPPPAGCDATPYNPQTENLMSYSFKSCRDFYSLGQVDKFRLTLENDRQELAIQVGDIHYLPTTIGALNVAVGGIADTTVTLENVGVAPVNITSVSVQTGLIDVSGPGSTTLNPGATQDYVISFDASALAAPCDFGSYFDIVTFTTTDLDRPTFDMAITVVVGSNTPTQSSYSFGPNCLNFGVGNTPNISSLTDFVSNVLFDASLLIGTVDGNDTNVYQHLYSQEEFSVIDGFTASTDSVGRVTQTLQFLTADSRIFGSLTYSYGANTAGLDSCGIIQIEYSLNNACDSTMTVALGMFADFDIDGSSSNDAIVVAGSDLVYVVQNASVHCAGYTNLTPSPGRAAVAISNPESIYPTSRLEDNEAYQKMVSGNSGNFFGQDVSALLSFGDHELPAGGQLAFAGAIVTSTTSTANLVAKANAIRNFYTPPDFLCGDADGSEMLSISDAVTIVNYIFAGGPAPDPLLSGDADCSLTISIADAVYIVNHIFAGGPVPCASCP